MPGLLFPSAMFLFQLLNGAGAFINFYLWASLQALKSSCNWPHVFPVMAASPRIPSHSINTIHAHELHQQRPYTPHPGRSGLHGDRWGECAAWILLRKKWSPTPELLTVESPTHDTVSVGTKGMATERGAEGKCESWRTFARGLLFVFHVCDAYGPVFIAGLHCKSLYPWPLHKTGLYLREASIQGNTVLVVTLCAVRKRVLIPTVICILFVPEIFVRETLVLI